MPLDVLTMLKHRTNKCLDIPVDVVTMLKHRTHKCLDIPVDVLTMLKHRTNKCLDIPVDVYFNSTLLISFMQSWIDNPCKLYEISTLKANMV